MKPIKNTTANILLIIYTLLMIWLLFGQRIGRDTALTYWDRVRSNTNFVPLFTVKKYIWVLTNSSSNYLIRHAFINLVGNVIMFVPLGVLTPFVWTKLRIFWKWLFYTVLTIICIEVIQLFTLLGSCDIDDLILNIIGAVIGYGIFKFSSHIIIKHKKDTAF